MITQTKIFCEEKRFWYLMGNYDEKKHFGFSVSSSCFWFVYIHVTFRFHLNRTRVCLEADKDPIFPIEPNIAKQTLRHLQLGVGNFQFNFLLCFDDIHCNSKHAYRKIKNNDVQLKEKILVVVKNTHTHTL